MTAAGEHVGELAAENIRIGAAYHDSAWWVAYLLAFARAVPAVGAIGLTTVATGYGYSRSALLTDDEGTYVAQAWAITHLGSLTPQRDMTFIADTVEGFIAAAIMPGIEGATINLGTNSTYSIGEFAERILKLMNCNKQIRHDAARGGFHFERECAVDLELPRVERLRDLDLLRRPRGRVGGDLDHRLRGLCGDRHGAGEIHEFQLHRDRRNLVHARVLRAHEDVGEHGLLPAGLRARARLHVGRGEGERLDFEKRRERLGEAELQLLATLRGGAV